MIIFWFIFQSLTPPDLDPKLTIERFDRTEEQNEELGLNDMKVDGYGEWKPWKPLNVV